MNPIYIPEDTPIRFLKRNSLLIGGVAAFVMFWVLVYAFTLHSTQYAAKSVVIIKDSAITSRYVMPEQYYALQTTTSNSSNPVLNTMGLLKSKSISDALYDYFQEKRPEELSRNRIASRADWDRFFLDGSSFIKAKNQPGTDLITVEFEWDNPVVAQEALQVVVNAFQQASLELNQSEQRSRTSFLEKQVEEVDAQLAAVRSRKTRYRQGAGTVSVKRESDDLAGSRMELGNRLSQIEASARGKEAEVARYQKMLGMNPEKALKASALGQNATMAKLQDELYQLQQKAANLRTTYTENNPKVKEVQSQIDQIKADIEAEKVRTLGKQAADVQDGVVADTTRGTVVASMVAAQAEANRLRSEAAVIRNRLGEVNGMIQRFPQVESELAGIEQEEASLGSALDNLRQKVMEAKVKEEQTLSNVFIVDPPRMPVKPEFPTQLHLVVLSVVMGLGAGVVTAMGKEQLTGQGGEFRMPTWMQPVEGPVYVQAEASDERVSAESETAAQPLPVSGRNAERKIVSGPVSVPEPADLPPARPSLPEVEMVPVAGPMAERQPEQARAIQQDIMQAAADNGNGHANGNAQAKRRIPAVSDLGDFNRAYSLYQPVAEGPVVYNGNGKVRTAKPVVAEVIAARQPQAERDIAEDYQGVPVMHASPAPSPKEEPVPAAMTLPRALEEEAFGRTASPSGWESLPDAPARPDVTYAMPEDDASQAPVLVSVGARPSEDPDEMEWSPLPEPAPRRGRGLPAFLMDEMPEPPRKSILSAEDDLMQDVDPLPPPVTSSQPVVVPKRRKGQAENALPGSLPSSMNRRMAELVGSSR